MPRRTADINDRLSKARHIVESALELLASRWRIYFTRMAVKPETAKSIVKATCVLHNMLQISTSPMEIQALQQDYDANAVEALQNIPHIGARPGLEACHIRDTFKVYFVNINTLLWQHDHIRRGIFNG